MSIRIFKTIDFNQNKVCVDRKHGCSQLTNDAYEDNHGEVSCLCTIRETCRIFMMLFHRSKSRLLLAFMPFYMLCCDTVQECYLAWIPLNPLVFTSEDMLLSCLLLCLRRLLTVSDAFHQCCTIAIMITWLKYIVTAWRVLAGALMLWSGDEQLKCWRGPHFSSALIRGQKRPHTS